MTTELDQLAAQAAAADAGAVAMDTPPEDGQQEQQGPDYAIEARGTVDMITAMIVGYAPKTESVWTDAAKGRVAMALAPVLEKYGFSFGSMPCELTLAIVAGPLLWQSSRIVAAQMAEDKAKAQPKKAEQVQNSATPEPEVHEAPKPVMHPQMALYQK